MDTQLFAQIIGYATVAAQIGIVALAILAIRDWKTGTRDALTSFLHKHALKLSFVVSLVAMVASLVFSNVIGYPPCDLCWYQRIFLFSNVFLLGFALWRRERSIVPYALMLTVIGGLIALDHVWLQSGGSSLIPCPAPTPTDPGCNQRFVYEFGYVTIPVMSLTAFAFIGALLAHARDLVVRKK